MRPLSRGARGRTRRRSLRSKSRLRRTVMRRVEASLPPAPSGAATSAGCACFARGPLLAWRVDSGSRRGGRRAPPAHQRSSGRPAATRPRHDRAHACVGTRRAEGGRDVELELRDRMADRHRRPFDRPPWPATARSRSGVVLRSRSGSAQRRV
jgi:hypothetical protein